MTKQEYEAYLESDEWKQRRMQTLERDGFRCRLCDSGRNLQVHHRTYAHLGNEPIDDLTTLCGRCHQKHHGVPADGPKSIGRNRMAPDVRKDLKSQRRQERKARKAARKAHLKAAALKFYGQNTVGFDSEGKPTIIKHG